MLAHLLHLRGIESVVLEARSREYVEQPSARACSSRARSTCCDETGVGERLHARASSTTGIELRFDGERHRIDFAELTGGRTITVYGQQEVVKDLIAARLADRARRCSSRSRT